ncbi:MAG: Gfo/Idh/MocA family oxidoreductase [Verrucomicrobiota bacterium]|jgi:predicted dehydrogenase
MNQVRLGIIGMGHIGKYHADYLLQHKVSRCELVAVCSRSLAASGKYTSLRIFTDANDLIKSREVDAVIIATPHLQHAPLGIAALGAGVHVLVEKPIAWHKADAERLVAAHQKSPRVVFAAMLQLRAEPRYLKIQQLIREGALGQIVRVNWINTDWYRTEAYYASSDWRATWKGEGGGVLLNQCLHNLDMMQWLCGMPQRLRAFCQFGRFHNIEVEDQVTAWLEWADGATGAFIGSSGEAPGANRFEIAGTRGALLLENNRLTLRRNDADMIQFSRTARAGFLKPEVRNEEIPFEDAALPHAAMTQNFVNAILDGQPLIAPGEEGVHSVELANAMVYSSLLGQTVELPMSGAVWEKKLQELIAESKVEKKGVKVAADDFAGSFRK